jgi:SAM-dependent methyltransferase
MARLLGRGDIPDRISCAVDVGGDEGQFFPDIETDRRIVVDVSNRQLLPGVERMASLDELGAGRADLVILAHVLEHLPSPPETLAEIRNALSDQGLLYVEVPHDAFHTSAGQAGERYRRYLAFLSRHRWLFVPVDFCSGLYRQFRSRIPIWGIVKQSEHINYFSGGALQRLLEAAGFRVVADQLDPRARVGHMRIGRYGVVARPAVAQDVP